MCIRDSVEALKIEEDRLQKAQEMRAQFARRQQAVNAAITVSNAIAAVARAALEGGGFGSVATIAALLAALAAGYAAVTSMSNDNAYADGVVDFKGKGGPRDDANWVRISSGESVITAEGTRPVSYTHLDVYKRQALSRYISLTPVHCFRCNIDAWCECSWFCHLRILLFS